MRTDRIQRLKRPEGFETQAFEFTTQQTQPHEPERQGKPLEPEIRTQLEPNFQHSFANVRVFSDIESDRQAQGLEARAFTVGQDIHFAANEYAPSTNQGKALLAHELTHVVQNDRFPGSGQVQPVDSNHASEREANNAAQNVMSGSPVSVQHAPGSQIATAPKDGATNHQYYTQNDNSYDDAQENWYLGGAAYNTCNMTALSMNLADIAGESAAKQAIKKLLLKQKTEGKTRQAAKIKLSGEKNPRDLDTVLQDDALLAKAQLEDLMTAAGVVEGDGSKKGYGAITHAGTISAVAEASGLVTEAHEVKSKDADLTKSKNREDARRMLENGQKVVMGTTNHYVSLLEVRGDGLVVNDPAGMRLENDGNAQFLHPGSASTILNEAKNRLGSKTKQEKALRRASSNPSIAPIVERVIEVVNAKSDRKLERAFLSDFKGFVNMGELNFYGNEELEHFNARLRVVMTPNQQSAQTQGHDQVTPPAAGHDQATHPAASHDQASHPASAGNSGKVDFADLIHYFKPEHQMQHQARPQHHQTQHQTAPTQVADPWATPSNSSHHRTGASADGKPADLIQFGSAVIGSLEHTGQALLAPFIGSERGENTSEHDQTALHEAQNPETHTEHPASGTQAGMAAIQEETKVSQRTMLHAEEIFRDVTWNTVDKKHAFVNYANALKKLEKLKGSLSHAKNETEQTKIQKALDAAEQHANQTRDALKNYIVEARLGHDANYKNLKKQSKKAEKTGDSDLKESLDAQIETLKQSIRTDVESMKHTDANHQTESVFDAVKTDVTQYGFTFEDGEKVTLNNHIQSYATSNAAGVDSIMRGNEHQQVETRLQESSLSDSKKRILKSISGFEGGFDTVNTYDRAKVTWGFVQWTGGDRSDLTEVLSLIKQNHSEAFAKNFQAYGIDVIKDKLVVSTGTDTPPLVGNAAAEAIANSPRLTAALAHAGRNKEVQTGQVEAAATVEIDKALDMKVKIGQESLHASDIVTSDYGVALLANTFVHSGSGTASRVVQNAVNEYLKKHPFVPGEEAWLNAVEALIVTSLAGHDSDRAAILAKTFSKDPRSFQK
jgi:Domain of unknown function (DUF4157)